MEDVNQTMLIKCEWSTHLSRKAEIGVVFLKSKIQLFTVIETPVRFKDKNLFKVSK